MLRYRFSAFVFLLLCVTRRQFGLCRRWFPCDAAKGSGRFYFGRWSVVKARRTTMSSMLHARRDYVEIGSSKSALARNRSTGACNPSARADLLDCSRVTRISLGQCGSLYSRQSSPSLFVRKSTRESISCRYYSHPILSVRAWNFNCD